MPNVSVIIPVYNVEKYLTKCLESVVNQTLKDIEIICINDGSTDNSLSILEEYAQKDARIKIINKQNSGYGASMNMGLNAANSEYIGIVESDDFIEPDMFEKLYLKAKENDLDLVRCCYFEYKTTDNSNTVIENGWVPKNKIYCPLEEQAPFWQAPAIWCNLFKKEMIEKNHIRFLETPGASYQDTSFAFKLYASAKRFMMIEDALLHYRVDNINSSVNSTLKAFFVNKEYAEIIDFSLRQKIYPSVKKLIPKIKKGCYLWNLNRLDIKLKPLFLLVWGYESVLNLFLPLIYSVKEKS